MKYLLLIAVVMVGAWLLYFRRIDRKAAPPRPPRARRASGAPSAMVACAHCGMHVPRDEALVAGDGQAYCTEAHRLAGPRQDR